MRVTLLTSARTWRGSTVSLSGIAAGLRRRGHDIRMLVGEPAIAETLAGMGIPVEVTPSRNTGLREVLALRRTLRDHGVQALVADRPRDLRIGALASADRRIPLIYRFNVRRERPPLDLVTRLAYRRVASTIFLTPGWAERTLARAPFMARAPYRVIWNGVDVDLFRPDQAAGLAFRDRHRLGTGPLLVASGALYPDKRFEILIEALPLLKGVRPPLVICGAGVVESALREGADRLGVAVRFVGFQSHQEMCGAYNAATVVVHAGPFETFGRSVAEAMACARPVVAVSAGALVDVVGEAGLLLPPNDPAAFALALDQLLPDESRRVSLGRAGRARCVERFSEERSLSDYESLFLELIRAR
jgi:glycosyltransferase involved in cell wall biosynthesis